MRRSAGVTASSIIVFIGSGLTLMFAALMAFSLLVSSSQISQPQFVAYFVDFFVGFVFVASGWGIATGVGLVNLRSWARTSMLIFGGLLIFFDLPGLVIVPFIPMAAQNGLPSNFVLGVRVVMEIFYAALAALGGWWLYFFNKKAVRAQFANDAAPADFPASINRRPLSIAIIGWYLLASSVIFLSIAGFRFPLFLFGYLIRGNLVVGVLAVYAAIHILAGIGLLKLRPWGRTLTICYFSLVILQTILSAALPGSGARFQEAMAELTTRFNLPPTTIHFSLWFSVLSVVPLYVVLLWFLITRKRFFKGSQETPSV
jgi:hypothetical protein